MEYTYTKYIYTVLLRIESIIVSLHQRNSNSTACSQRRRPDAPTPPVPLRFTCILLMKPEDSAHLEVQGEQSRTRPDIVGFYKCQIVDLLSQDENIPSLSSSTKEAVKASADILHNGEGKNNIFSNTSLFSNSIENVMPEYKRELLKTSLRQSVKALTQEVDEVFDPVIRIRQVMSSLKSKRKENSSGKAPILGNSATMHSKKLKTSCSNARERCLADERRDAEKETDVDENLKLLLESEDFLVEEIMAKHSDELYVMLNHLDDQLEELLYVVVSKCRLMTPPEKQHLRNLMKKLPARNLDRIVEILYHGKSSKTVSLDTIFVDLEEQENSTLWRLYFYVKAAENATKLSA